MKQVEAPRQQKTIEKSCEWQRKHDFFSARPSAAVSSRLTGVSVSWYLLLFSTQSSAQASASEVCRCMSPFSVTFDPDAKRYSRNLAKFSSETLAAGCESSRRTDFAHDFGFEIFCTSSRTRWPWTHSGARQDAPGIQESTESQKSITIGKHRITKNAPGIQERKKS